METFSLEGGRSHATVRQVLSILPTPPDIMASLPGNSWALTLTTFFMRCCGFWAEETKLGKKIMKWIWMYSLMVLTWASYLTGNGLWECYGDFDKFTFCSLNVVTVVFGLYKLAVFTTKRKIFLNLVYHAKSNFWYRCYDDYGSGVMQQCMTRGLMIVMFASSACHFIIILHLIKPLIVNRGATTEAERVLPFSLILGFPTTLSPWYEVLYFLQVFTAWHCCVCYFSFDNFLCQINLTLVGQFRILGRDFREIYDERSKLRADDASHVRARFVKCIQEHQQLITFTETVKALYRDVILGIVVLLTFMICLELFKLMRTTDEPLGKLHYCAYVIGSLGQLYYFTLTCNDLTEASLAISDAAYDVQWYVMSSEVGRNALMKDLPMVILRAQKPTSMTIGQFAPVTLMTFTSICNRSFSFLTLLRQSLAQ